MSRNEDWYEHANDYWEQIEETRYLNADEIQEIYPTFLDFLADVMNGAEPVQSQAWEDLAEYFGWDADNFDWEEFREWYDTI
jgi:hypothetical protein